MFVAYTWEWQDYCNNDSEEPEEHEDPAESYQSEDEPDPFDSGFVTHTITFKCICASREDKQQETLQAAAKCIKEGKEVPIRLQPEPENPVDCTTIAFQCCVHNDSSRVGYVVQEALPEVHDAIQKHEIVSVRLHGLNFCCAGAAVDLGFMEELTLQRKEAGPEHVYSVLVLGRYYNLLNDVYNNNFTKDEFNACQVHSKTSSKLSSTTVCVI